MFLEMPKLVTTTRVGGWAVMLEAKHVVECRMLLNCERMVKILICSVVTAGRGRKEGTSCGKRCICNCPCVFGAD